MPRRRSRLVSLGSLLVATLAFAPRARGDEPPAAPQAPVAPAVAAPAPEPPSCPKFTDAGHIERPDGKTMYFYRTNFVDPKELVSTFNTLLKLPGVELRELARQNRVIVEGTPDAIETALDAFTYFDVPDPQVFVESKIVEITYDSNFEFGVSWLLDRNAQGPNTFWRGTESALNPTSFFQNQQPGSLPFQGTTLGFGFVGKLAEKYGAFDLALQALQQDGSAEVLSRPSILATQGKLATVKTSRRTPILKLQNANLTGALESVNVATDYVETKIELAVTADFIGDGFVRMEVSPTVSGVTGYAAGQSGTTAPIIAAREAKTTVTLADNETLVVGGLYTNSTVSDTSKVPLLGELPLLGKLFTRSAEQKVKTELVFFITPRILRKRSDFKVITPPGEAERLQGEGTCPAPSDDERPRTSPFHLPTISR